MDRVAGKVALATGGAQGLGQATAELPDREKALAELQDAHPIGYLGDPGDVAYGVLYLASDESKWVPARSSCWMGWTAA